MSRRVYELAKDLDLSSREVIAALASLGVVAKSHSSTVEEPIVAKLQEAKEKGTLKQLAATKPVQRPARPVRPARPSAERPAGERAPAERAPAERAPTERPPAERAPAARPAAERAPASAPAVSRQAPARPAAATPAKAGSAAPKPAAPAAAPAAPPEVKQITIERGITVRDLAAKLGVTAATVVQKLIALGEMKAVTQSLSDDEIELLGPEFGFKISLVTPGEELEEEELEEEEGAVEPRPPVITVMGHVDHGKTLLLDKIRAANVVAQEHGGITQHIGAYQVDRNGRAITFIDTPGHEAFTQMRARGAKVTDIAVLVVAADDGVKPQTVEAISHAKAADVPIVVAVNKIDKPEADPTRVRQQLTEHDLVPEEWGGKTVFVDISAKAGTNIDQLLEMLLLVADLQELKANATTPARGVVIEAHLDKGRGPVATVLVQRGTLKPGDMLAAGASWARVRAMLSDAGDPLQDAGPGTPAQVLGFDTVPAAGDEFRVHKDERTARQIAQDRATKRRVADLFARKRITLEDLSAQAREGEQLQLNIVLKADVQGSLEAVTDALEKMKVENASVLVLHRAVGAITENDISLAAASDAIVVGFNVRPGPQARALADEQKIEIRTYQIIYKLVEEVEASLKGMLKPLFAEAVTGRAVVRQTFKVPKIGVIAGSYLEDGTVTRGQKVRLVRDGVIVADSTVSSLRRFKDDVREVAAGYECGIGVDGYGDIKEGDTLEFYEVREVVRT